MADVDLITKKRLLDKKSEGIAVIDSFYPESFTTIINE